MVFDPSIGRASQFRKGVSGNPGGRPKSRVLSEALRNRLGEVKPGDPEKRTWAEVIASNLVEIACGEGPGAVHAANEIADRIEGRPAQHLQISDFADDLHSRSDAELQFFLDHSRWPDDAEEALLLAPVSEPAS
jgi:hypothetical protein